MFNLKFSDNKAKIIFVILATLLLALYFFPASKTYPVIWTNSVNLNSLKAIPELLQTEKIEEVNYINDKNIIKTATTCHQYFELTASKFDPMTNADIAKESHFKKRCDTLKLLMQFKPAKYSYLRHIDLKKEYPLLPVALIFPVLDQPSSTDVPRFMRGIQKSGTRGQPRNKPGGRTSDIEVNLNQNKNAIEIISKKAGMKTYLEILAWGDFNQDGYDDILVFVAHYALQGTYHAYKAAVLTRKSADGPFELLQSF